MNKVQFEKIANNSTTSFATENVLQPHQILPQALSLNGDGNDLCGLSAQLWW
jgi:hypothetical protein